MTQAMEYIEKPEKEIENEQARDFTKAGGSCITI